ncbi:hypothetical protein ACFL0I_00135 [Gemmatimonadota bacterium]
MKRSMTILPLALLVAACSGGMSAAAAPDPTPAPPPQLNPVGVYDCHIDVEGTEMGATLTITGTPDSYGGRVDTEMGPGTVTDVVVTGNEMTFVVDTGDMTVYFAVVFEGDNFQGEFDAGGMGGYISGTKR